MHHDDEFGIVIHSTHQEELNILYIPSTNTYWISEFSREFSNFSDLLIDQGITGESVNEIINYVEPYLF